MFHNQAISCTQSHRKSMQLDGAKIGVTVWEIYMTISTLFIHISCNTFVFEMLWFKKLTEVSMCEHRFRAILLIIRELLISMYDNIHNICQGKLSDACPGCDTTWLPYFPPLSVFTCYYRIDIRFAKVIRIY